MTTASRDGRAGDPLRQYLKEIGSYDLLTAAEEVTLATRIDEGRRAEAAMGAHRDLEPGERARLREQASAGQEAKATFIQANLRLVVSIAKRYQPCGLPLLDLIQEGNLGLMRAVDKFDYRRGFKFSTYATWWIRQSVSRAIADKSRTIRVPVHMVESVTQVSKAANNLSRTLGRQPTTQELAAETGISVARVREAQRVAPDPVSLFESVGEDHAELADFLADPGAQASFDAAAKAMEGEQLRTVLATLADRERRVLELRFGLVGERPQTLEEVAHAFGLTRERIRQIETRALAKLRHPRPGHRDPFMGLGLDERAL